MEDLAKLAHPKSKLILSGILREQNEKVIASLCEHNLDVVEILEEENWSCIIAGAAQK
jgi:ribosomal protein L11 methylase PrmA